MLLIIAVLSGCCLGKIIKDVVDHLGKTSSSVKNTNASNKKSLNKNNPKNGSSEEEFFCLTPEDARSICSNASDRSRNASSSQSHHGHGGHHHGHASHDEHHDAHKEGLEHQIPDTKIFSVAVEAKAKEGQGRKKGHDGLIICDVDTDYTGRFAVVSDGKKASKSKAEAKNAQKQTKRQQQQKKDIKYETSEDLADEVVTDLMEVRSIC